MGHSPFTDEDRYEIAIERGIIVDDCDKWMLFKYTWSLAGERWPYPYTTKHFDGIRYKALLHHMIVGYPINGLVVDHVS